MKSEDRLCFNGKLKFYYKIETRFGYFKGDLRSYVSESVIGVGAFVILSGTIAGAVLLQWRIK